MTPATNGNGNRGAMMKNRNDAITEEMMIIWRINYGLDTMTPHDAMRWWNDHNNGSAPAGAVAALGLALLEIERLRSDDDITEPRA